MLPTSDDKREQEQWWVFKHGAEVVLGLLALSYMIAINLSSPVDGCVRWNEETWHQHLAESPTVKELGETATKQIATECAKREQELYDSGVRDRLQNRTLTEVLRKYLEAGNPVRAQGTATD